MSLPPLRSHLLDWVFFNVYICWLTYHINLSWDYKCQNPPKISSQCFTKPCDPIPPLSSRLVGFWYLLFLVCIYLGNCLPLESPVTANQTQENKEAQQSVHICNQLSMTVFNYDYTFHLRAPSDLSAATSHFCLNIKLLCCRPKHDIFN